MKTTLQNSVVYINIYIWFLYVCMYNVYIGQQRAKNKYQRETLVRYNMYTCIMPLSSHGIIIFARRKSNDFHTERRSAI